MEAKIDDNGVVTITGNGTERAVVRNGATVLVVSTGRVAVATFPLDAVKEIHATGILLFDAVGMNIPYTTEMFDAGRYIKAGLSLADIIQGGAVSGFSATESGFLYNKNWRPIIRYAGFTDTGALYNVNVSGHVSNIIFDGNLTGDDAGVKDFEHWAVLTARSYREGWPGVKPHDVYYGRASPTIAWMNGQDQLGQFNNKNIPVGYAGGTPPALAIAQIRTALAQGKVAIAETHLTRGTSTFYQGYVNPRLNPAGHYAILRVLDGGAFLLSNPLGGTMGMECNQFLASCSQVVVG